MESAVLILGDPVLRRISKEITDFSDDSFRANVSILEKALEEFRRKNGYGRGIAAVQIGIPSRFIALNFGKGPFVIVNPKIVSRSSEEFYLWDDCMSFPDLFVRVKRSKSINIRYQDDCGKTLEWNNIGQAESELLQHEIDHLDGVMAIDLVEDVKDIIYKSEYNKNRDLYRSRVDYMIESTI
jgi:peptide deformylase